MRAAVLPLVLIAAACQPAPAMRPTLACVAEALGTETPEPAVVVIRRSDMERRFGNWDAYFDGQTVYLTSGSTQRLRVHEAVRAAGMAGHPGAEAKAQRACGGSAS